MKGKEMEIGAIWFWGVLSFVLGLWVGQKITEKRWTDNATDYRRLESGGKLYKVDRAE